MAQRGKYYLRSFVTKEQERMADICYYDHVPGDPPGILRPHYLIGGLTLGEAAHFVDELNEEALKPTAARNFVAAGLEAMRARRKQRVTQNA